MKHIAKNKFTSKQRASAILLGLLVILVASAIVLGIVYKNKQDQTPEPVIPEIIEGEALYGANLNAQQAIAYPSMDAADITYIDISSKKQTFGMYRPTPGESFELYYTNSDGEMTVYYPDIAFEDSSFDYESVYSIYTEDGFGTMPKLFYLTTALRIPYFSERIPLSDDAAERESQLKAYGLTEGDTIDIFFAYNEKQYDEDGKLIKDGDGNAVTVEKTHRIKLGKKDLVGRGYYFTVDGRDHVYSTNNTYFDDAVSGFNEFIKPTLVAAGLESDISLGPTLTTGFYHWKEEQNKTEGATVPEDSRVIVFADTLTPPTGEEKEPPADGYLHTGYGILELDLSQYKDYAGYENLVSTLVGQANGAYGTNDGVGNIVFSAVHSASDARLLDFSKAESLAYSYSIISIDAIVTSNGDICDTGYAVGANTRIRVSYSVTGPDAKTRRTSGVIDLGGTLIPEAARTALSSASVGTLASPIAFDITYSETNALSRFGKYKILEISHIYDKEGREISKVTDTSVVSFKYAFEIDGDIQYERSVSLDLATADGDIDKKIKAALVGKKVQNGLDITVDEYTAYFECILSSTTYKVARIDWFVTSTLISAFRFLNESERDPFYGGSIYENLMNNKYSLYGINDVACEGVTKLLGGIDPDGQSLTAVGLAGSETIEVGITPALMEKYGLYKNRIYYELPRGITNYTPEGGEDDENSVGEYSYYEKLGFTLYFSDPDPVTGERYVASEMYDIISKIDGEDFFFLDSDFPSFWARRNMVLLDISNVSSITAEFGFDDLVGKYKFDLNSRDVILNDSKTQELIVKVTPEGECTPNKLTEYIAKNCAETGFVSLGEFFEDLYPNDPEENKYLPDTVGTTYFKELILMLWSTDYEGGLTAEEQTAAFARGQRLLRLELKTTSAVDKYVYEFYAVDASRVMVTLHRENASGTITTSRVSDFYISTFAFKKIALNGFANLLDGVKIDIEDTYPDIGMLK